MRVEMFVDGAAAWETFAALEGPPGAAQLARYRRSLAAYDRYGLRRHLLLLRGATPVARVTASLNPRLCDAAGRPLGLLGHVVCPPDDATLAALLAPAVEWLQAEGARSLRAPVTNHTWLPFRFVTGGSDAPPFFGEPDTPRWLPDLFARQGFRSVQRYFSALSEDLERQVQAAAGAQARAAAAGYRLRPLRPADFATELALLHDLALRSFRRAFSYCPIDLDEFVALYSGLGGALDPGLIWLAEDPEGALAGFIFCLRSPDDPALGLVKTLAIAPERWGAGLGAALTAAGHAALAQRGCRRVVHALMRTGGASEAISGYSAKPMREYCVMDRALQP